jgi:hypothetical protein
MLKHIVQKKRTECGTACVAILCGTRISEARDLLGQTRSQKTGWTGTRDIRTALAFKGLRLGKEVWSSDWNDLVGKAMPILVAVNYKEWSTRTGTERASWHWAVYDASNARSPLLDPLTPRGPRVPGKTRLCSYFHVHRTT